MAKKGKTESVLARETRLKNEAEAAAREAEAAAQAAKDAEAAAELAAEEKRLAAEAAPQGSGRKRAAMAAMATPGPKRARFVREKKEAGPEAAPAPLAPRSTKTSGKMMTRNLALPPKDEPKAKGVR